MSEAYDFRIVRPLTVDDAMLTSSTVPETTVTAWAGGTTYADGDIRGVSGANNSQVVYESLQGSNTGNTPASSPDWWKELGTVYGTYAGGTTYAINDVVTVIAADSHKLYRSAQNSNTGNAVTDDAWWTYIGYTNRWKMFDNGVQTQTTKPEDLTIVLTPGEIVSTLALLNTGAASATLTQSVSGYSETKNLVTHDVDNWFDYFYQDLILATDVAFDDIPPYPASTLTLTISNPDGTVSVGCCYLGKARTLGTTLWDFKGSIVSYSRVEEDDFGNMTITSRPNVKRLNFEVIIAPGLASEALRILRSLIDTPIVVIGSREHSMAIVYCMLGACEIPVTDKGIPATIEVKELV